LGSTTFRLEEKRGGAEPDESYCIEVERDFPDLAIEVIVTSGGISQLEIYSRLNVKEVWFWKNDRLILYCLRDSLNSGFATTYGYRQVTRSELLTNLDINVLTDCIRHTNPLKAAKIFRKYLKTTFENS
jgi:Uma2 family endonuclease